MSDWIVPCNMKKYNVLRALTDLDAIDWVKNVNYSVDDNVYIYVSGNVGAIRYKCKVTKIGIETPDIDDSEYGVIDHNEGATYVCFERVKQYSGDVYSLEKLREKGLRGNLQSAERLSEDLQTYLNSYDTIEQHHYSVKEAVWISAALKSYVVYKQNQLVQPSAFFFTPKEIIKTALLFSNGKVDAARVSQWFNGSNLDSLDNYLCNTSNDRYRLSYFGEFNGEKEFPATLRDEDILLYSDSQLTIAELKTFVKEVYTPIVSKIQPGFSNFLKRIIDERPFDIPANAYTTENAYFALNRDFCSYIKQLPFVYPNCFEIGKAQGRNTLPTINWNGIRTNKNDGFCSSFQKGIYLVYLYSYDKNCVYLTLNQGCSAIGEELGPNNDQAIIERLKQNANDICREINIPQGFSSCLQNAEIELGSDNSIARKYEAGAVIFRKYETSSMPDDETLAEDLRQLLLIYQKLNKENKKMQNKESLPDVPDDSPALEATYKWDKNLILYGPPGTGKTYRTAYYAVAICEGISIKEVELKYVGYSNVLAQYNSLKEEHRIEFTTFHQSYGYEEFIEGIKPDVTKDSQKEHSGDIKYKIEPGVFKSFCKSAPEDKPCVFIIDEINRGNISKIFGELITLIEETKRKGMPEGAEATLPYSKEKFSVPQNVYILGTMNTADRSIALMDTALRRRFNFVEMMPDAEVIRDMGINLIMVNGVSEELDVAKMLETINRRIECLYDREHTIGHAFFTKLKEDPSIDTLAAIFKKSIIPLLQEYFYEDYYKIQLVLGDNDANKPDELKFILDAPIQYADIFNGSPDIDLPEKKYSINESAFTKIESYRSILGA